ncbi:MAG TPA: DNA repair protein RecO [Candidatus Acidoferrum sp.]|nr:DNA repair protein RecO [Candidatus Acidoferrum sp.]
MVENTRGLVLRTRLLTETSLIVHWLSADLGRVATVAKGALRPKSPFRGKLDLFYLADLSFSRSRRSELHTLREVSVRETHPVLRQDLACLRQAAHGAALVEQATEVETPLPAVFDMMLGLLKFLGAHGARPEGLLAFELRLLAELGLAPDLEQARVNPDAKQLMQTLAQQEWDELARLCPSAAQLNPVRRFLHGFLIYHLGKVPKGREAALA